MPDGGKNRLALIARASFIAGALLVGIPIDTSIQLRFFLAGMLIGTAIFLIMLSQWTRLK
jgi:hypothetical protein